MKYSINFTDGAIVKISDCEEDNKYDVMFTNIDENKMVYRTTLSKNEWAATNIKYFINWNIKIIKDDNILVNYNLDLQNKNVLIRFDSRSIGDTLAWIPYVDEFRKKHKCTVYCATFLNDLLSEYKDIIFVKPGEVPKDIFAVYTFGWYVPWKNKNRSDYKKLPMQQTASDILGLDFKEIIPKIKVPDYPKPYKEKYVCIAEFSTANAKHWHYPVKNSNRGWQKIVDWLNYKGYKVMVISRQNTRLKNVINRTGSFPLEHRIYELSHCEFFIGIGSGLSWLAWAIGKKVVMISGFSDPICEFKSNNIRIVNKDVCYGCFNKYVFDKGDWNWCPVNKGTPKQFECTTSITPYMVAKKIVDNGLIDSIGNFDMDIDSYGDKNKDSIGLKITNKNKLNIYYYDDEPIIVNIEIRNEDNKLLRLLSDTELRSDTVLWYDPIIDDIEEYNVDVYGPKLHINKKIKINNK